MGFWDFLFAKAVLDTAKEVKKEIDAEKTRKNIENQQIAYGNLDSEKIFNFVRKINKTIPPYKYKYQFDINSELSTEYTELCEEGRELDNRQNILSQLKSNPNSLSLNIRMIENLIGILGFNSFYDKNGAAELYFIEECRYYIEKTLPRAHTLPSGIGNKYLLLSIDAELYMMQGNFVCALKRYFEILSWPQMIMNIYNESWNFDCTEELYGYAVANIMSIFKILGLKQESYDISNLFHKVLQYHRKFNQENIKDEYTRAQADTYFPNTEFTGFHVYSANRRKMSLLDWTTFPQIYTDYHLFTKCGLEDGDLYFIYGPMPIRKELIEAQKQPVLDLLNGNECKTDFNAYDEKFITSIDSDVAREQDESDMLCISSDDHISEFSKLVEGLYVNNPHGLEPDSMVGDFLNSLCFVMAFNVDPDTGDIAEVLRIYFSYCNLDISVEQFMDLISENENLFEHYATSYQMAINLMLHRGVEINDTSLAMQCIDKAVELFTEIENIVIEKYPDIIYKKLASEVILDIVQTILDSNQ